MVTGHANNTFLRLKEKEEKIYNAAITHVKSDLCSSRLFAFTEDSCLSH